MQSYIIFYNLKDFLIVFSHITDIFLVHDHMPSLLNDKYMDKYSTKPPKYMFTHLTFLAAEFSLFKYYAWMNDYVETVL